MTCEFNKWEINSTLCEKSGLYFNRYFIKQQTGSKMIVAPFHKVLQSTLDRTMLNVNDPDYISRLIINIPPGYGKTQLATIAYMARGLAINSRARFMHLSYSHTLALKNSSDARLLTRSTEYQQMYGLETRADSDSKSMWWTIDGGGVYASSAGGQVTGFRAGQMGSDDFTGALIVDDPLKPDDAYSELVRESINNRFNETIASRLAVEHVPIIVIMQRIHPNDLSGYLLRGGSGEKWHHLNMPVLIDDETYSDEYTHGIEIEHGLDKGWLWEYKHNDKHEVALRSHRRKFAAQYMQRPLKRNEQGALWTEAIIAKTREGVPAGIPKRTLVAVDPAVTNKAESDEHGIIVVSDHGGIYTADGDYTSKGSPKKWADRAISAYNKHSADAIVVETNQGGDMCEDTLRNAGYNGRVIRVHASKGKIARAEPIAALYEQGKVKHKSGLLLLDDELLELDAITGLSSGKSPNRVDALVWGLTELSGGTDVNKLLRMSMS